VVPKSARSRPAAAQSERVSRKTFDAFEGFALSRVRKSGFSTRWKEFSGDDVSFFVGFGLSLRRDHSVLGECAKGMSNGERIRERTEGASSSRLKSANVALL